MALPRNVKCPICRKTGDWLSGPFAPFCSKRCKLVDLGKWFNAEHVISEPLTPDHFAGFENLPSDSDLDKPTEG